MLRLLTCALCWALLYSCSTRPTLVAPSFVDSLLAHYQPAQNLVTAKEDLAFWKKRVDSLPFDITNQQKWAGALSERFQHTGDIADLVTADSILSNLNQFYSGKEPGILLALAHLKMSRHDFRAAQVLVDSALTLRAMRYATTMAFFDVAFERGDEVTATSLLHSVQGRNDYGYYFRLAKLEHNKGNADSAIAHMEQAGRSTENPLLKASALSNAADLELHSGNAQEAADLYRQCLRLNPSDFHSMTGLGRIALVHDRNTAVASRIFHFVSKHHQSPEPLWRLAQAWELTDSSAARTYAEAFASKASARQFGNMYNKYLVDQYTGILKDPAKALAIATRERGNRATPQTAAWLAWSLVASGKKEEAYTLFKKEISGHPLETLELFWIGKMMRELGKKYDAQQYLKAAQANDLDLSPRQQAELSAMLN